MMKGKFIISFFGFLILSASTSYASGDGHVSQLDSRIGNHREILKLQQRGMHNRASVLFGMLGDEVLSSEPEAYSVLNDVLQNVYGYDVRMRDFLARNPHSALASQIRFYHAVNLFDAQNFADASDVFSQVQVSHLEGIQVDEYIFKKSFCELEAGDRHRSLFLFKELASRPFTDYTAPAAYAIAYVNFEDGKYKEALDWFEISVSDVRFFEMSSYYIVECHFLLKDYEYVAAEGEKVYADLSDNLKPFIARMLSEAWLVKGDASKASNYYELFTSASGQKNSRSDWFYSGSLLYALKDYRGAIDSFNAMGERKDSIGQVANYHLGFSYIQTRNKVAALDAFKNATQHSYDQVIAEDAYFNWAKLAFDINNDPSVFQDYMKTYPDKAKDDRIYSYIAVAALHNRDYATAVDAYGMIDELDDDMRANYMKANYLRANQLVASGSYRMAIPCLRVAGYYSEKSSRFNQLTRFWLAESYYRNDQYAQARELFTELYNQSALNRQPESELIPYNIAYCYFDEDNYDAARKWFANYAGNPSSKYRKDALERIADCYFVTKEYKSAADAYDKVLKEYYDVNDIYPYYQSAISYGLAGNNAKKIKLLSKVMDADASSRFYPEAMFELGRAYVMSEDDDNAFSCFKAIAEKVKDNTYVARAYIEMGSLSRNQSQFKDALKYYKKVVEEMPQSGYADDALAAIESVYQTRNEPEEYLRYIDSIGKGSVKTDDEKESMIFNSAEQVFLTENYQKALTSLQAYLEKFPAGKYAYKADYYIAESYRMLGKYEQACDGYSKVIGTEESAYVEQAMLHFSNISFKLEKWEDAFGGYSSLYSVAAVQNNRMTALKGMMQSAYKGHNWSEAVKASEKVLAEERFADDVKREAQYIKAKSLLATSRRAEALEEMSYLAMDVKDKYGAEAAYMLIMDAYDKGDFDDVRTRVYAFSDSGSRQTYWLAKSFIVLGDAFADEGNLSQAKATFESVAAGYKTSSSDDDVLDNVRMRLAKLDELMAQNN